MSDDLPADLASAVNARALSGGLSTLVWSIFFGRAASFFAG